ncbi:MAG TPA: phospholipase D-like domain-containing protein [Candidatus Eremiobacteraceae bacterium]|nr:phospholipase D-like domain-containing protein [Candidatus Eremiobacteraceae bacterium]
MSRLLVHIGSDARTALCEAFASATTSIDAEFYSIGDRDVVESLNDAAHRGVHVRITLEGDTHRYRGPRSVEPEDRIIRGELDDSIDVVISRRPHPLVHGKAAVIDHSIAFVATANATQTGFASPGEVAIEDRDVNDADEIAREIDRAAGGEPLHPKLRDELRTLFSSRRDLRIASEDLSDWWTVAWLVHRARAGRHDRVLIAKPSSRCASDMVGRLVKAGVEVRTPSASYMHEKFVDDGKRTYVGSANLTRNGIDESYEVGIVADSTDFIDGGTALRADFDRQWSSAREINRSSRGDRRPHP